MSSKLTPFFAFFCLTSSLTAQPTDNAVASHYGSDAHPWTDDMYWDNVHNVLDYGAVADGNDVGDGIGVTDNLPAYLDALDAVYEEGGGVIWFPAGTYYFSDSLPLKDGVILRGPQPSVIDAHDKDFRPQARLEFPKYFPPDFDSPSPEANPSDSAFKAIGLASGQLCKRVGLVWLDINRARISIGSGSSRSGDVVILGIRQNNVNAIQPWTVPTSEQHPWQRHPNRFVSNIGGIAFENYLIANCRLNDNHYWHHRQQDERSVDVADFDSMPNDEYDQPGYIVRDRNGDFGPRDEWVALPEPWMANFSYTNHYGIRLRGSSGLWGARPDQRANLFRRNMQIVDNWVYTTMRVGIMASGDPLIIRNNKKLDRAGKVYWLDPNGDRTNQNSATLENRGIDFAGRNIYIEDNHVEVERHRLRSSGYASVDGEGIMVQEIHGTVIDGLYIRDNYTEAYIGIYKMPYTRNVEITGNTLGSRANGEAAYILLSSVKNGSQAPMFDAVVDGNVFTDDGGIRVEANSGGANVSVTNNTLAGGSIRIPDFVNESGNTGQSGVTMEASGPVLSAPLIELVSVWENQEVELGATLDLVASVSDTEGLDRVDFYANETLVGTSSSEPWQVSWTSAFGNYQLTAIAWPSDYASNPTTETEWFSISPQVNVKVIGGFELWQGNKFGSRSSRQAQLQVDMDGDGLGNLEEYAFGLDPATPNFEPLVGWSPGLPKWEIVQVGGENAFSMKYHLFDTKNDISTNLLFSTDLESWNPVPRTDNLGEQGGTALMRGSVPTAGNDQIFLRFVIDR
jgi:hypothetical protein